jgi:hypothetical protein
MKKSLKYFCLLAAISTTTTFQSCDQLLGEDPTPVEFANIQLTDLTFNIKKNEVIQLDLLKDSHIGKIATVTVKDPVHGEIVTDETGKFQYYISKGYYLGEDSFEYEVCADGECQTAKVTVNISDYGPYNCEARAVNDYLSVPSNTSVVIRPIDNDIFCGYNFINLIRLQPKNGKLQQIRNHIIYTPNTDFKGYDIIEYELQNPYYQMPAYYSAVEIKVGDPAGSNPYCNVTLQAADQERLIKQEWDGTNKQNSYGTSLLFNSSYCPLKYPQFYLLSEPSLGIAFIKGTSLWYEPGATVKAGDEEKLRYRMCHTENGIPTECTEAEITIKAL